MTAVRRRPRRLVLFDIDGTLLTCGPRIRTLFSEALERVFGVRVALDGHDFSGKTDDQITVELLSAAAVPEVEVERGLAELREVWAEQLGGLGADEIRLLPAVREALDRLHDGGERTVGLLTGNWQSAARVKLGRLGLERDFPFGAFGDGHRHRNLLPPVALERAAAFAGRRFEPDETLIVGDSPRDVACAHAHGIAVAAVATGRFSEEELAATGADWVIPDLAALADCPV